MNKLSEALRLYQDGRYDEASRRLRVIIEFDRENVQAWTYYAACLAQMGRWSQATDAYRQVVDLQPDEPSAYVDLGAALFEQGLLDQAADAVAAALALEPRHPIALRLRRKIGSATLPARKGPPAPAAPAEPSPARRRWSLPPHRRLPVLLSVLAILLLIVGIGLLRKPGEKWRRLAEAEALLDEVTAERTRLAGYPGEDFQAVERIEARQDRAGLLLRSVAARNPGLPEVHLLGGRLAWSRDRDPWAAKNELLKALALYEPMPSSQKRPLDRTVAQRRAEAYRLMAAIEAGSASGPLAQESIRRARDYLERSKRLDPSAATGTVERAIDLAERRQSR